MMIVIVNRIFALASDIKRKMIERAAILLATKGLQGTSFTEVLEASGAPRGSLYHHFPGGKDELVLDALDAAGERALAFLGSLEGKPAIDVATAFVGLWRMVLERSKFGAGCAVVAVTVATDQPELIERAASVFRGWRMRLAELLAKGGLPQHQAASTAASLIAACEGGVIMARAERAFEPFDLVTGNQLDAIRTAATNRSGD
jgi:TetR/AcrR family transcriptional regulator, lmrAB and yxaGH operons repressor